jgi:acetyl-CoA carboxylase biotin carboxyl carrier protein
VSNPLSSLTDDEVRQVALLIETLDQSTFDYLQLEVGNLKVTIGKGAAPVVNAAAVVPAGSGVSATALPPAASVAPPPTAAPASMDAAVSMDGSAAITAPIIGRFYAQPQPGAPPFVALGSEIDQDSTVGLIEVMKTFNAVRAGISGVVTEICVQDGALVEYGQVLFRVRPALGAAGSRA